MKIQALFSSKDKRKNLKCHLLQFLIGTLRVNKALCAQWVLTRSTVLYICSNCLLYTVIERM